MPILPHVRVPEHDRPAEQRTVVFVVSKVGPVPAADVAELVAKRLADLGVDQARALVLDLTSALACPVCGCAPMTCETGCGHMCCCPDSYPLPAAALLDDGGALNDHGRDYVEEAWQRFEARCEAEAELAEELRIVDTRGGDDWASFAERFPGPVVVCVDELAAIHDAMRARRDAVFAQRTEFHLDLADDLLVDLAARAVQTGGAR